LETYLKKIGQCFAVEYLNPKVDNCILVVGRKVLGAIQRISQGHWSAKTRYGAMIKTVDMKDLTQNQKAMVEIIKPYMDVRGIFAYGVDALMTLGGSDWKLSEIETVNVGLIYHLERETNIPYTKYFAQSIVDEIYRQKSKISSI
jgi:glutathione synthase/RimK-type ligase-like ATP-grasp enzyme